MKVLVDATRGAQELYKALDQLAENFVNSFNECKGKVTRKIVTKERV